MWQAILRDARAGHGALFVFGVGCLVGALLAAGAGVVDGRTITGAAVWTKPFKFFVSVAAYVLTVAWYLGGLSRRDELPPGRLRIGRAIGWAFIPVFIVELGVIALQAGRGVASHFNRATPLDSALFDLMGGFIFLLTLLHVALIVVLLRTGRPVSPHLVAMRWGLGVGVASLAFGWLMVAPTSAQLEARGSGPLRVQGAHAVGGPDGGAGLPVVNWSTEFGDRRVAHFVGLHAMQGVPLIGVLLAGRWPPAAVSAACRATGLAWLAVTLLLALQASQARPVLSPGPWLAGGMLAVLLAATAYVVGLRPGREPSS